MKTLMTVAAAMPLLFTSCAAVEFIPYEGSQQRWATSAGAGVDRRYALPIYYGRPPRPYVVLGTIYVSGAGGFTKVESATRDAISEAQRHGADAVVLIDRGTESIGTTVMPVGYGYVAADNRRGHAQVIAIKWR